MRILFIRHGEPNYEKDCLTGSGRRQAEAVAARLAGEGIEAVFASPMGRALETARPTARRLGLPVAVLDFMHEIDWGGPNIPENGHPWTLGDRMIADEGYDFLTHDWREHPYFRENVATEYYAMIADRFDGFLAAQGYVREGTRYRCGTDRERTIALFSHGGSGACALSRLLNLPFPYVCSVLPYDFTSVIIVRLPVEPGRCVRPRLELFNDCAHLAAASDPKIQATPD